MSGPGLEPAGELYMWLAAALDQPDMALLHADFADLGLVAALDLEPAADLPATTALAEQPPADDQYLLALHQEYARLFIGPPQALLLPYESCAEGERQLMGPSSLAVQEFYAAAGIRFDPDVCQEAPDHIVVELQALALICTAPGDHSFRQRRDLERHFLHHHLGRWAPSFASRLRALSEVPLYLAVAELLELVVARRGGDD